MDGGPCAIAKVGIVPALNPNSAAIAMTLLQIFITYLPGK